MDHFEEAIPPQLPHDVMPIEEDLSFREKFRGLREAAHDDYSRSGPLGKLGLISTAAVLAYEWGPGNETVTPIIAGLVINNTSGVKGLAATAAIAAGFTFLEQTASGAIMASNVANYPTLAEKSLELSGAEEDTSLARKGWNELSIKKRLLYGFTLGTSYIVAREAAVTGETNTRAHIRHAVGSAALTSAAVGTVATAVNGIGQATDHATPWVERAGDIVIGVATSPVTWLSLLGISTFMEHRARRQHRRRLQNTQ